MAAYNRKGIPERILLHGFLITFSLVFVFPFVWMICNSAKVQREMASSKFKLLPTSPHVKDSTPYFDPEEFDKVEYLDQVDKQVWEKARPEIEKMLSTKIKTWTPKVPGDPETVSIPANFATDYEEAMVRGLLFVISNRISDDAREAASKENAQLWKKENPNLSSIPKKLRPEAIDIGAAAIAKDAEKLVTEDLMQDTLDRVFRRFCLSKVKLRVDNKIEVVDSKDGWKVLSGEAKLEDRAVHDMQFRQSEINYASKDKAVFTHPLPKKAGEADRYYVGFRGDDSWARLYFEINRNGKIYRTDEVITCSWPGWTELELRLDTEKIDPIARRTFFVLKDTGKAAPAGDDFKINIEIAKSSKSLSWYDKITRNYLSVFREVPFARYIMTSFALCILNIVLTIFSCTLTAYAFARLEWPGRNMFFAVMMATMMIPGQVVMIPGFLINRYLGLYNSLLPLWLFSMFGSAFFIFLLRQFMMTIPKDLEDAAKIDGCGFFGIYWHVIMPLIKPTIATIAIFTFTGTWNNFMGPLIYVNDERLFPLALGLFKFNLVSGADTGLMMASSFLMTLPIIILFFYAQKYFIQGIALTGTKE